MLVVALVVIVCIYREKGFQVKAIDISKGAIEVAKQRGVLNAEVKNVLDETELL